MTKTRLGLFASIGLLSALAACETTPEKPQPVAAIAFQADIQGCRKVTLDLYEQISSQEYMIVDRIHLVDRTFGGVGEGEYDVRGAEDKVFVREMDPGRYFVRAMTCNSQVPRQQFTFGGFEVVSGRTTYIGDLTVGRRSGRVLMEVDNNAEAAYNQLKDDWPAAADNFGVLLMATLLPTDL